MSDPDQETTRQVEHLNNGDSHDDLSRLSELARKAYEQRRTTECLDLTRAILLIDPENPEAQSLRNAMRASLHKDLEKARALFRTTERAEAAAARPVSSAGGNAGHRAHMEEDQPVAELEAVPMFREELAQRAASVAPKWRPRLLDVAAALIVLTLAIAAIPLYRSLSNGASSAAAEPTVETAAPESVAAPVQEWNVPQPLEDGANFGTGIMELPLPSEVPASPEPTPNLTANQPANERPSAVPAPARDAARAAERITEPIIAAAPMGTLAVSALAATEIYSNGRHLGSAPASIRLPAGTHILEYRHGDLRKSVSHVIRGGETTLATITFDISVSINANPWAEVFVDGAQRKSLGETPLSGVQLPIGSVLIFENPKFESRRYRVNGDETGIQISFK